MQKIKKLFPLSDRFSKDGNSLAIGLLIYIAIWLIGAPVIGFILGLLLGLITCGFGSALAVPLGVMVDIVVTVYSVAGIVFLVLNYSKNSKG